MIGRLLSLGLIEIDQFTLTKEALELVDKEFAQVFCFHLIKNKKNFFVFENRLMKKYKKQKLVLNNLINN